VAPWSTIPSAHTFSSILHHIEAQAARDPANADIIVTRRVASRAGLAQRREIGRPIRYMDPFEQTMTGKLTRLNAEKRLRRLANSKTYSLNTRGLPEGLGQDLAGSLYYEGDCPELSQVQILSSRPL
jgi:hypothetical protein